MKQILPILLLSILCYSCDREITRFNLLDPNEKVFWIELKAGEVVDLYTEMDVEYGKYPDFVYDFDFVEGGTLLFKGGTDPLEATDRKNESKTTGADGITHWKFYGKLKGNLTAKYDGVYGIKPTFVKNKTKNLKINKAEIVFVN